MITVSKLRFQPLKDGDITVTATITKEMVESFGGVEAAIIALAPLMAAPELQIGTSITQSPKTLAGQLQSVYAGLERLSGGVEHIKSFIDGMRQTELPIEQKHHEEDDQGHSNTGEVENTDIEQSEVSAAPQTEEPVEVGEATSEEKAAQGDLSCYHPDCHYEEKNKCISPTGPSQCDSQVITKPAHLQEEDNG